jgi:exodeoxyribonuclease VII large subunit
VIATGKITTFPGSSKYQIVIEALEPAGAGALMALIEERKRKLGAEGLFDPAAKQLLPFMPQVIGVITSPTGAVIRDILHRISDRFPVHVIVWPVKVQGEGSGDEVANAIRGFNALGRDGPVRRPDVLIVARGGGSLEDLWSFNDEAVVRAAAASDIPLISAVGHETDWTLIDYAADVRAPTPTGAAEMAVPVKAELQAQLANLGARLQGSTSRQMDNRRQNVRALVRALPSLDQLLALPRRRFDEAGAGLGRGLERTALVKRRSLERAMAGLRLDLLTSRLAERRRHIGEQLLRTDRCLERQLMRERGRIAKAEVSLAGLPGRLLTHIGRERLQLTALMRHADSSVRNAMGQRLAAVAAQDRVLQSLSYKNVLKRGYAVIQDADGKLLTRAEQVASGQALAIQFADGEVSAVAGEGGEPPATPQTPTPKKRAAKATEPVSEVPKQGSLF